MTTDTTTAAVTHLRAIRGQWGDLLAAIDTPPAQEWPPVYDRAWERPPAEPDAQIGRLPLTLREHPAPLNLGALDAACATERDLFDLADFLAGGWQRPVKTIDTATYSDPFAVMPDPIDADDIDRWHYPSPTSPGSRRQGLHWCAVWIERALSGDNPLCRPLPALVFAEAEQTIARCDGRVTRALGRDGRAMTAADPCPWCHGTLTMTTTSGDPHDATVTCDTGPSCTAPAPYDRRARRVWTGNRVPDLIIAILHARHRAAA